MAKRHTDTWKHAERAIAAIIGGKRRGADFRGEDGGKSDIIKSGFSIEVKHSKVPTFGLMREAVSQAEANRPCPDDIPVAIIHKERQAYEDSLVVMSLKSFMDYFMGTSEQPEE